jgi:hypothetical protein
VRADVPGPQDPVGVGHRHRRPGAVGASQAHPRRPDRAAGRAPTPTGLARRRASHLHRPAGPLRPTGGRRPARTASHPFPPASPALPAGSASTWVHPLPPTCPRSAHPRSTWFAAGRPAPATRQPPVPRPSPRHDRAARPQRDGR